MSSGSSSDSVAKYAPQEVIDNFWEDFITKKPAKVTRIFPSSLYANLLPPKHKPGKSVGKNAAESYEDAAAECRARVKKVVTECHRTNEKFTDPEFDIEYLSDRNCLEGLKYWYNDQPTAANSSVSPDSLGDALSTLLRSNVLAHTSAAFNLEIASKVLTGSGSDAGPVNGSGSCPGSVHRVDWIFEKPEFEIDGFDSSDVVQGANGDCWFIAALATICSNPDLMKKVCVARDEECGVYGFVFYRDGDWIWTVVDDNLYLDWSDFDAYGDDYDPTGVKETRWKKNKQTGSEALYFASCANTNETWLPLLEKAYAKVHGDYHSISGGWSGEAVEDLTGGVTTKILTSRVLSKERLWKELLQVNKQFLFSASSPGYGDDSEARQGLAQNHAYSVLKAVDVEGEDGKKHQLVLIRNPWGSRVTAAMGEWTGAWSDGSREWTPYWMKQLDYKFGDDGVFWMSYEDLLKRFHLLDRTRLFDHEWTVVQHWTSTSVGWVTGYLNTKFLVEIKKDGPTVFVLCQLDKRYFKGLEGKYDFDLHFILQEQNCAAGDHIVRARGAWFGNRSISAEVDLKAGVYEVLPKIEAFRKAEAPDVQEVVTKVAERNPQKLRQIGLNYDIANAKGLIEPTEEEKKKKQEATKKAADQKKKREAQEAKEKEEFEMWKKEEKATYEAWKKDKTARDEKDKPKDTTDKVDTKPAATVSVTKASDITEAAPPLSIATEADPGAKKEATPTEADKKEAVPTELEEKATTVDGAEKKEATTTESDKKDSPSPKETEDATTKPDNDTKNTSDNAPASSPSLITERDGERIANASSAVELSGDAPAPAPPKDRRDDAPKSWNAVCVLGLRVYSKDTEVSIKIVKPKNVEEGAMLDVDGETAAGATM